MRRLCALVASVVAFAIMAAPAGAQEAPDEAAFGLCTAHVAIPASNPADEGVHIAHEMVPGLEFC